MARLANGRFSTDEMSLAQDLKRLLGTCIGFEGDDLAKARKSAYDYYFQRPRGDEVMGRSTIVSGDLSAMVEGNLAQMVEPLVNKRIGEFCAYDADDEEQAQLESDCVSEMVFKRQNGFIEVSSTIKDILLVRNGVVKTYVDVRTYTKNVSLSNVEPEIIPDVLDKIGDVQVHSYDSSTGDLSATLKKVTRKFCVESIAPENFLIPKNWHRQDLDDIPVCSERHVEPRSSLIERGFPSKKVEMLRRYTNVGGQSTDARLPRSYTPTVQPFDKSQDMIEWYETYVKMDDGNGASIRHRICHSDQFILEDVEEDLIPYSTGVAIVNPHTWIGISLFDKLKSTQDSTTAFTRALMDNLNATNKNRTAHLDGVVEPDDLTDGRVNGSIRVNPAMAQDVRQAITAFQVPDTSANILANLAQMRQTRSEMGGASLDMATGQAQLSDRVGSIGLDRAYSVMEALAAFMTRMVAQTLVRSMYLVAHEVLRTQWQGPISFKRGKQWLQQDPSKWQVRDAVSINLGASLGERMRISSVLDNLLSKQVALAQNGMEDILVNSTGFFTAAIEWLRVNDIPNPERYFLDPRSPESQKAFKDKAQQQQAAQQKQDNLMAQAVSLEQLKVALEKYQTDVKTQFEYYQAVLTAQIEEARIATPAIVDLMKTRSQAKAAQNGTQPDGKEAAGAKSKDQLAIGGTDSETGE